MIGPWLAIALLGSASAQVQTDGGSLLDPCLADPACGDWLLGNLSEALHEIGVGLQHQPLATSAIAGKGMGVVIELSVASTALEPANALVRDLTLLPALPRIEVGYQYGSYTYDDPYPQIAVGGYLLPPLRVFGAQIWSGGIELSGAVPVAPSLWLGAEVGAGHAAVEVPLLGSVGDVAAHPEVRGHLDRSATVCADGCVDTFDQDDVALRIGASVEPVPALFLFARGALVGWRQRLVVALDDSVWTLDGWQPQAHVGGGVRAGDKYQLSGAVVIVPEPEALTTDGGALVRAVLSTSFRFGQARYWESSD